MVDADKNADRKDNANTVFTDGRIYKSSLLWYLTVAPGVIKHKCVPKNTRRNLYALPF